MLFDIYKFPKVVEYINHNSSYLKYDAALRDIGYPSAKYIDINQWYLNDVEFTWFVLKWS